MTLRSDQCVSEALLLDRRFNDRPRATAGLDNLPAQKDRIGSPASDGRCEVDGRPARDQSAGPPPSTLSRLSGSRAAYNLVLPGLVLCCLAARVSPELPGCNARAGPEGIVLHGSLIVLRRGANAGASSAGGRGNGGGSQNHGRAGEKQKAVFHFSLQLLCRRSPPLHASSEADVRLGATQNNRDCAALH